MAHEWFIIHTLSGQEQKVLDSINKRIDVEEMGGHIKDVFVAKEKVVDVRGGEKKVSTKKLFPGYVFIHMQLRDEDRKTISEPLNFIKDTPGAIGFVGGIDRNRPRMPRSRTSKRGWRIQRTWNGPRWSLK